MILTKLVKKKPKKPVSLRDFHERRNRVLVRRRVGGFGDILMHRMIFEEFHRAMPDVELHFSCPHAFSDMAEDHPFLSSLVLDRYVEEEKYGVIYDTTLACGFHETKHAPYCQDHRSDIWAAHCGLTLSHHEMHLKLRPELVELGKQQIGCSPSVCLATCSNSPAANGCGKSLTDEQIAGIVTGVRERGYFPFTVHPDEQPIYTKLGVHQIITRNNTDLWKAVVAAADYVVAIDSATFHMAGGLKKPMTAVFAFTDGKVYGKYYQFVLVQKHRDDGNWDCGPCWDWTRCPKEQNSLRKPCMTLITPQEILKGFDLMTQTWPVATQPCGEFATTC